MLQSIASMHQEVTHYCSQGKRNKLMMLPRKIDRVVHFKPNQAVADFHKNFEADLNDFDDND